MRPYLAAAQNFASGKADAAPISRTVAGAARAMGAADRRLRLHQCAGGARGGGSIRPRAGVPASRCRRSTACRSASRTSSRPSTCRPRWARRCLPAGVREKDAASVRALRDAGAVIVGKTVTTEFAASEPRGTRNPWNTAHTPGGSSSGSAASVAAGIVSAGARHPGDQLDRSSGELLRLRRLQADGQRAQPPRQPRLSEPELHRHSRRLARRHLAGRLRDRRPRRRRCRHARPARTGQGAGGEEAACARHARNRRLGRGVGRRESAVSKIAWRG